jgi:hypothetical protein
LRKQVPVSFSPHPPDYGGNYGFGGLIRPLCIRAVQTVARYGEEEWDWKSRRKKTEP